MKHLFSVSTLIVSGLLSTSAVAQNNTFAGFYFGGKVDSVKQTFSFPSNYSDYNDTFTANGSRGSRFGVVTGYGFDYGANFVGQAEASVAISNVKTKNEFGTVTKEKLATSLAYLQGYRIANRLLPYVKVSLDASSFDVNNEAIRIRYTEIQSGAAYGIGFGGGLKVAVTDNFNLGMEYHKVTLKGRDDIKIKSDSISLNAVYRF